MKRSIVIFLLCIGSLLANAQDSCGLRISLLTCTPGSELYSIFGHSALRVVDSTVGTDIVFNYGTFEFDDPEFYSKFVRGKLLYFLSREAYPDFAYGYQMEGRGIDEQILTLSCKEKQDIGLFLHNNLQDANKYYKYDFLYDNCTTRLRDIFEKYKDSTETIATAKGMTFRNGIHYYLDHGKMYWSKLGIDLLLGARIDKKMTNREAMFLPEFLEEGLDHSFTSGRNFVSSKQKLLARLENAGLNGDLATPIVVFSVFGILIMLLSFSGSPFVVNMLRVVDKFLFLIVGLMGCLVLFMWVGTDHKQTANNYNLFWAWPIHIVIAFILYNGIPWIKQYLRVYMAVLSLLLVLWAVLPQELNPALIPMIILLLFRSWKIIKAHGDKKTTV
jgi:hypothetical protein